MRSIRFFRHPYQIWHLFNMSSVIHVICHIWHKWQMTDDTNDTWRSRYWCLKKHLDIMSQARSMKLITNVIEVENTTAKISPLLILEILCIFGFRKQVFWRDPNSSWMKLKFCLVYFRKTPKFHQQHQVVKFTICGVSIFIEYKPTTNCEKNLHSCISKSKNIMGNLIFWLFWYKRVSAFPSFSYSPYLKQKDLYWRQSQKMEMKPKP